MLDTTRSASKVDAATLPIVDVSGLSSSDLVERQSVGQALHAACVTHGFFADVQAACATGNDTLLGITPHLAWTADGQLSTVPAPAAEAAEIRIERMPQVRSLSWQRHFRFGYQQWPMVPSFDHHRSKMPEIPSQYMRLAVMRHCHNDQIGQVCSAFLVTPSQLQCKLQIGCGR